MDVLKKKLSESVNKYYKLDVTSDIKGSNRDIFLNFLYDKRNAALGDSLVNFVYSCSKSIVKKEPTGIKISDSILVEAFTSSKLSKWLNLSGKKKDKANAIESLILYAWIFQNFSIEEMVLNLSLNMEGKNFNSRTEEERTAVFAFITFFDAINNLVT